MSRRPPSVETLQKRCDLFNARVNVGDRVTVVRDDRSIIETTTTSPAEVLSGHSAVIWLDGIRGCYLLDRVTPLKG